jgi:hypothetical protein
VSHFSPTPVAACQVAEKNGLTRSGLEKRNSNAHLRYNKSATFRRIIVIQFRSPPSVSLSSRHEQLWRNFVTRSKANITVTGKIKVLVSE